FCLPHTSTNYSKYNCVGVNYKDADRFYNSFSNKYAEKPLYVGLAHELIHVVHYLLEINKYIISKVLKKMDTLEEQHTILGYNHLLFTQKKPLKKIDVLSETAFLLAVKKPPRIDHYSKHEKNTAFCEAFDFSKESVVFGEWVKKKFHKLFYNPKLLTDKSSIDNNMNLIQLDPSKIHCISHSYKEMFFYCWLNNFPAGLENIEFAKEFIDFSFSNNKLDSKFRQNLSLFDKSILADKDFVLFLLGKLKSYESIFDNEFDNPKFFDFLVNCQIFDDESKGYVKVATLLGSLRDYINLIESIICPKFLRDDEITDILKLYKTKFKTNLIKPTDYYVNAHYTNVVMDANYSSPYSALVELGFYI
ncbi:MAG TPA: hypothetical protein VGP47_10290, partial [Parachlamydiaceae bacterium]|nr:hypothetical protein [Parachlamydiaceae bacterium]